MKMPTPEFKLGYYSVKVSIVREVKKSKWTGVRLFYSCAA